MDNDTSTPDSTESVAPKRTSRRAKTDQVVTPEAAPSSESAATPTQSASDSPSGDDAKTSRGAKTTRSRKAASDDSSSSNAASAGADGQADDASAGSGDGADDSASEKKSSGRSGSRPARGKRPSNKNQESEESGDTADSDSDDSRGESSDDSNDSDSSQRGRGRGRGRDRRRGRGNGGDDVDPEISDDDVLIPIGGILDVLDNYAFVRTTGYLPGPTDIYVSLGQVKKYNLRKGDAVIGSIRQPREGEMQGRQKYNALVSVDTINAQSLDDAHKRPDFASLTAIQPTKRLSVAGGSDIKSMGLVDLFAPLAMGQRGIIVAPPKSGKSTMVQRLAEAIAANHPDVHLMVVLVDENPETVTELQRSVKGEVIASTFDRPADDHTTIAELAIERAKRLVELGHDVVVIFDSVTRLARAYQLTGTQSRGSQQADAAWLYPTKRLVGAGRQVEGGGSLTVLGTLLADTGQAIDDQVAHEISQLATVELVLSSEASRARLFPAIDVVRSGTSRDEALMGHSDATVMDEFRRHALHADQVEVLSHLMAIAEKTPAAEDIVEKLRTSPVEFRQGA
ncbi:transcription termination factor Rho [Pontimonas salivibrio]|uniref:Transcription termination factor Rho n=1 Tax=Pontimonas salivibrio TaxID=1159327 RepID=A0A2L2BRS5_9MICO|nr:transcription termination factor Rho [Pontimonas salivibrio]AVG24384.1 transcription termination factor Rho [Pontimonas salivibrio]